MNILNNQKMRNENKIYWLQICLTHKRNEMQVKKQQQQQQQLYEGMNEIQAIMFY